MRRALPRTAGALAAALALGGSVEDARPAALCRAPDPEPPPYYAFELVPTGRVPGTGRAKASADVLFAPSPFGVALAPDGSYLLDVRLRFEGLRPPGRGAYVAWVTTPSLDRVQRVGAVAGDGTATSRVAWNKFLVVVTLEPSDDPAAEAWTGPVVLRGMSRSGMMHTMAGHGPFQQENCARYGYQQD